MIAARIKIPPVRMDCVASTGNGTYSSGQWLNVVLAWVGLLEEGASLFAASVSCIV